MGRGRAGQAPARRPCRNLRRFCSRGLLRRARRARAGERPARSGLGVTVATDPRIVGVRSTTLARPVVRADVRRETEPWRRRGSSVLYVVKDGVVSGALSLEDRIRPEAREAVDRLHELGIRVALITGDARPVADTVAADLGIDEVFAEASRGQGAARTRAPGTRSPCGHGR